MKQRDEKMGLLPAIAIAVGTMIGASIFSIFGLGARIAGHNLPLVFVISGFLALLVAYSYATLGGRIISNAGPMEFILRGFGDGVLTGALSILFWISYVVSIALFAKGFAGYFIPLAGLPDDALVLGLVEVSVVALFTALNLAGTRLVGRAELFIVLIKLGILGLFVVLGLATVNIQWITPSLAEGGLRGILDGTAIFFLSYMGFGLVTNASENIRDPQRNVPRAIYLSILIVTLVYVGVSVAALGNLPLAELVKAEDFALAEAARPFLGAAGYLLVSVGALFSIASALNATLYGGANIAYALARDGELPKVFERKAWFGAPEGLYLTAGLSMAFTLFLNLDGIASMTSAVFMMIYLFVIMAHLRLVDEYGGNRPFLLFSLLAVGGIFIILMQHLWRSSPATFWTTWLVFAACLVVELVYRGVTHRHLLERHLERLRRGRRTA